VPQNMRDQDYLAMTLARAAFVLAWQKWLESKPRLADALDEADATAMQLDQFITLALA